MNKEEEVELQLAIRNHGAYDSAFDSDSSSGKSDFDEEYEAYKPPSISLQDRKYDIVKIGAFETVIHKRPKVKKIHPKLQTNKSTGLSILKKKNKQYYKGKISESISDNKFKLTNSAQVVKTNKKIKEQSKRSPSFPVNISQSATVTNTKDSVAVSQTITKSICKTDDVNSFASVAKSNTIYVSNNVNNPTKLSNVRQVDSINDNQYETVTKLPIHAANLNKQCKNFNLKYKRSLPEGPLSTQNNAVNNPTCSGVPNSQLHLVSSSSSCRPNQSKECTVQKNECNTSIHVPYSSNLTKMPDFQLQSQTDTNFCELYDDTTSKIERVNIIDIKNRKQQNKLPYVSGPALRNWTNSSLNSSYRRNQSKECTVQKKECNTSVHVPYSSNSELKSQADTNFCECFDDITSKVKLVNIVDIRNRKTQKKLPCVSGPALRDCTNSSLNTVLEENTCAYNKQLVTLDNHDSKISKSQLAKELKQKTNKGIISDKCAQSFVYSNNNNGIHDAPLNSSNKTSNQLSAALTNNQELDSMKVCKHEYIEKLSKRVNKKKSCSDMVRAQNETPSKSGENYTDIKAQNHLSFVDSQGSNKKKSRSGKKSVMEMSHSGTNIEQLQCNQSIRSFSETQEEPSENRHGNTNKFPSVSSFLNKEFEVWFMKIFSEPEKLDQPLSSAAVSKNVIDDKLTRKMSKDELFNYWRSGWNIISNFSDYKRSDEQMSHDRGISKTQTTETNSEEKIANVTKTTPENLQNAHCLLHQSAFDDQHIISEKKKPKKKRSRKKKNLDVDATQAHLKGLELLTFSKSNYKTDLKNTAPYCQLADTKINSTVNNETMNSLQITEIDDNCTTVDVTSPKCTKFSDTNKNAVAVMQRQSSTLNVKRNLYSFTSCNELSYSLFNMKLEPKVICQDCKVVNTVGAQPVLFYFVVMILRRLNNF